MCRGDRILKFSPKNMHVPGSPLDHENSSGAPALLAAGGKTSLYFLSGFLLSSRKSSNLGHLSNSTSPE